MMPPLALLVMTGILSVSAHADTVYSSFGPGQAYASYDGVWVGCNMARCQSAGMQFASSGNFTVTGIDLALRANDEWVVSVSLNSADSDGNIDAVLLNWTTTVAAQGPPQLVNLTPATPVQLTAETTYWLTVASISGNGTWLYGDPGVEGATYTESPSGSSRGRGTQSAFTVSGAVDTPEPAGALPLAAGLGLLGFGRLRRQRRAR
jgi:hypothetical protein